jgi:hypothetical protein
MDKSRRALNCEAVTDFLLTGCALAPALALYAGRPEIALLSHIVLLFSGLGLAGFDQAAPFKNPERFERDRRR